MLKFCLFRFMDTDYSLSLDINELPYMNFRQLFLVVFYVFFSQACTLQQEQGKSPDPWPYGTMYEIFVQSFADSDGDGIGDFNGLASKLDYLKELGIEGIWLMPINPSPSYHKYDVTDYYDIHPDYGTMEDFKNFLKEAHRRDIRVIIDLVVNHTSSEHPWFRQAVADPQSRYRDYYVWANIDSVKDYISKKEVTLDSDNLTQWHKAGGNEEYYYGFFWGGMPDLNFDNPEVRAEIMKIGRFWLSDVGVDGFRLDAARHIYPDDRKEDSHAWWVEFGNAMRAVKPDVYLVGEVWATAMEAGPYLQDLNSLFNFDFQRDLVQMMIKEKNDSLIEKLIDARNYFKTINPCFIDALFLNNHDQNRLLDEVGGDVRKLRLAAAIMLTIPGMPYLYYGDEIAMHGKKPDPNIREPFLWDYDKKAPEQTSWIEAVNSTDKTVTPLAAQIFDPQSTYHFFKFWVQLRNHEDMLRSSSLKALNAGLSLLAYERSAGKKKWVVLHNLKGEARRVNAADLGVKKILFCFDKKIELKNGTIELPPFASAILE